MAHDFTDLVSVIRRKVSCLSLVELSLDELTLQRTLVECAGDQETSQWDTPCLEYGNLL